MAQAHNDKESFKTFLALDSNSCSVRHYPHFLNISISLFEAFGVILLINFSFHITTLAGWQWAAHYMLFIKRAVIDSWSAKIPQWQSLMSETQIPTMWISTCLISLSLKLQDWLFIKMTQNPNLIKRWFILKFYPHLWKALALSTQVEHIRQNQACFQSFIQISEKIWNKIYQYSQDCRIY